MLTISSVEVGRMAFTAAANAFGYMVVSARIPQGLAEFVASLALSKWTVLVIINLALLVVGCFMETAAAITICVPVLMPLVTGLGIDPAHFGLVLFFTIRVGGTIRHEAVSSPLGVLRSAAALPDPDHLRAGSLDLAAQPSDGHEQIGAAFPNVPRIPP